MKKMRNDVNFRVKVDLSQFYNDKKKLSYIYIDRVEITNVFHLQKKIQNIFGIIQPLYLVINDVFLPVNEDIRIIKEDEVVVVQSLCPDSENTSTVSNTVHQTLENDSKNEVIESLSQCEIYGSDSTDLDISFIAKPNGSANGNNIDEFHVVESESPREQRKRICFNKKNNKNEVTQSLCLDSNKTSIVSNTVSQTSKCDGRNGVIESLSQCEVFGSDNPDLEISYIAKGNTSINGNQTVESQTVGSEVPRKKRKRIRRRKKNKKDEDISSISSNIIPQNSVASTNNKIAKVDIDIPNSTHLKFIWDESDNMEKQSNGIVKNLSHSKPIVRSNETINLESLLSLRNSQVPLTFSSQRRTRTNSVTSSLSIKSSNNKSPTKMEVSPSTSTNGSSIHSTVDYSKMNISELPIHKERFEVGDIVAFQTLILNNLYCPVLSDFIVAQITTVHPLTNNYLCKILVGFDQIKTPDGKFALPVDNEEEDLNENNLGNQEFMTFRNSDLYQPRLISRPTQN